MLSCTAHGRKLNPTYTIFLLWMLFLIFLSPPSFIVMPTLEENGLFLSLWFYSLQKLTALSLTNKDIYQAEYSEENKSCVAKRGQSFAC